MNYVGKSDFIVYAIIMAGILFLAGTSAIFLDIEGLSVLTVCIAASIFVLVLVYLHMSTNAKRITAKRRR